MLTKPFTYYYVLYNLLSLNVTSAVEIRKVVKFLMRRGTSIKLQPYHNQIPLLDLLKDFQCVVGQALIVDGALINS